MAVLLRRLAAVCVTALILPPTALAAGSVHSWAQPEIKLVTRQGIFAGTPATFHADDPLTQGALAAALAKLTATEPVTPTDTDAPVSLEQLDRSLVDALGLRDSAYLFYHAASAAGISAPRRFGSEVVARLLGLRLNHPAGQDDLELQPQQPATRAEAAYSLAQILRFDLEPDMWPVDEVKEAAAAFQLPALTPWQRRILTAFSYVGYPYVWGGTGEGSAGFDCSGFVWRVYKLTTYPEEGGLAGVLRGRTTMS